MRFRPNDYMLYEIFYYIHTFIYIEILSLLPCYRLISESSLSKNVQYSSIVHVEKLKINWYLAIVTGKSYLTDAGEN